MKNITIGATVIAIVGGIIALAMVGPVEGIFFIFPFTMGPLVFTVYLSAYSEGIISQLILLTSTVAYSGWFAHAYLSAFHWHIDPQSGLVMLIVGIYALPVLLVLWIAAWLTRERSTAEPGTGGNAI